MKLTKYKFDNSIDPKTGKEKHVHLLGEKELMGTTSLIKAILPPPLQWWASGKALEKMGWLKKDKQESLKRSKEFIENAKPLMETPENWYKFLEECYNNHATFTKQRAVEGTDTHASIEEAIKTNTLDKTPLKDWAIGKTFLHSEVHVFSEEHWLGGIVDMVYKENGEYYLADLKTSKAIYPSAFIQLGLYDLQQKENGFVNAKGEQISEPLDIKGYTVVQGNGNHKTYYGDLTKMATTLAHLYKTLKNIETICKN
jgi:hypothetical protein